MIEQALKDIGFTDGEIKIYLALLELGASSTGKITRQSGISGSKVYEVLDRLAKKGMVNSTVKNGVKHFEAAPPERILDYLDEKKTGIDKERREINKILPELLLKREGTKSNEAKIYTGFEGAKTAYEDAIRNLKKGEEILGWGLTEQPESWETYFNKRELERAKKGIVHKSIINEKYKSLHTVRRRFPNTEIRFFPKELEMPTTVEIWRNKVAIFIITKENPITIVIESEAAAYSFRKYFKTLWESAKK